MRVAPGWYAWAARLVAMAMAIGPVAAARADLPGLGDPTSLSSARPYPAAATASSRPVVPLERELEPALGRMREGRNEEALALIREAAARHPEWSPPPVILARLLLATGQPEPARLALERAAIEAPEHPEVYLAMGTLAASDGRFSDARLNFDRALALVASGTWDDGRARGFRRQAFAGLAAVGEAREDWPAARQALDAWLEVDPRDGPARHRLGAVLFRLGRIDEAMAALQQAARDAPELDPAAVAMARLADLAGDSKKAGEWFARAEALEPSSVRVRLARAAWLIDQGRAGEARSEVDRALGLDPRSVEGRRLRASVAWHLRDLDAAESILDDLHREAPADLAVANLLALCLVERDDPAKRSRGLQLAEVDARQAPRSPDVLTTLGWARYRNGRPEEAEALLRSAVQGVRISPDVAYFLARVLADRGRADDARKILQSATGLPGAFAHREDAAALLKSLAR